MFLENMNVEDLCINEDVCCLFALSHAFFSWCRYRDVSALAKKLNEWLKWLKPLLTETCFLTIFHVSDALQKKHNISDEDMSKLEDLFQNYSKWTMMGSLPNFFYLGRSIKNKLDPSLVYTNNEGKILNILWVESSESEDEDREEKAYSAVEANGAKQWYIERRGIFIELGKQIISKKSIGEQTFADDEETGRVSYPERNSKKTTKSALASTSLPLPSLFLTAAKSASKNAKRKNTMLDASLDHYDEDFKRVRIQADNHMACFDSSLPIVLHTQNATSELFGKQQQLFQLLREYGEDTQEFLHLIQNLTQKRKQIMQVLQDTVYSITDFQNGVFSFLTQKIGDDSEAQKTNELERADENVFGAAVGVRNTCQSVMQNMLPNVVDRILNTNDKSMESILPPNVLVPIQDYLMSRQRYPCMSSRMVLMGSYLKDMQAP